jgi:hypothetical protein
MKIILILSILSLFNLNSAVYGQKKNNLVFSKDELTEFSITLTKAQISYENMLNIVEFISQDSLRIEDNNGNLPVNELKNYISNKYKSLESKESIQIATAIDTNYVYLTNSLIFINTQLGVTDSKPYIMAIGIDGRVFFIEGFGKDEFEDFIKDKIRDLISANDSFHILKLYMETVLYPNRSYLLIDSSNINKYNKILNYLYPIKMRKTKNDFEYDFYTLEKIKDHFKYDSLIFHKFKIYQNCKIKYSSRIINLKKSL